MKKAEIIRELELNSVTLSNVKTFFNKNHKRLGLKQSDFDKVCKYTVELSERVEEKDNRERDKDRAAVFGVSVKELKRLTKKAEQIARCFTSGHSMGSITRVYVKGCTIAEYDCTEEYSRGCKYNAIHGGVYIELSLSQLRKIECIHGVWTVRGKRHGAIYLESTGTKGTYEVNLVKGYLYGESHASTLEQARDLFRKSYLAEKAKRMQAKERVIFATRKWVGFQDLKKIGACDPGISSFAQRHNLKLDYGYRLDYLLELEPNNSFIQRLFTL